MRGKSFSFRLITLIIGTLLVHITPYELSVRAQDNSSLFVGRPVPVATVRRVVKKKRRPGRARKQVERVPLLALQLRAYKLRENGSQVETNPTSPFFADDRLRLGVTANQNGYLTIIHQGGPERDGEILFPNSLINDGQNFVAKEKEFIVPSNCPESVKSIDCAYKVPQSAGREIFTFIFSRDLILDLPEDATTASGLIKAEVIKELEGSSGQRLAKTSGTEMSRYAILVINTNRRDNEEIVTRFGIINKGPSPLSR